MKDRKKPIYIYLGLTLLLWPLVRAMVSNGAIPPNRFIVYTSVILGCALIALTYRKTLTKQGRYETSMIAPLIMFIFYVLTSVFVYYISTLLLYSQLYT